MPLSTTQSKHWFVHGNTAIPIAAITGVEIICQDVVGGEPDFELVIVAGDRGRAFHYATAQELGLALSNMGLSYMPA